MTVSIIVAAAENNAIGKNNSLPWKLPNDMKFFKNTTWGMPVIMGRKTFESFSKALPGRMNVVVTTQQDWSAPGAEVVNGLPAAFEKANEANTNEIFIAGGGEIYKQALPMADRIYLTRVKATIDGDVFFPELNASEWQLVQTDNHPADEKHNFNYAFEIWERIRS